MNKNNLPFSIGIIVPCFNEKSRWNHEYWESILTLPGVSWVFVDDGSTDGTNFILTTYSDQRNVHLITLSRNCGKSEAIRSGFQHFFASGNPPKFIGFLDSDGAFSLGDIEKFTNKKFLLGFSSFDFIWSSRIKMLGRIIKRNAIRHYISRILLTLIALKVKSMPYDSQSGLKIFKYSEDLEVVFKNKFQTRWFFEIEIILLWNRFFKKPVNIWEEPVSSWIDIAGTKINGKELFRIIIEIYRILRFSGRV